MARLHGNGGSVSVAGTTVVGIKSWTLDDTQAMDDGRAFDDTGLPHPVAGNVDWSGSFEGLKDGAPLTRGTTVALILKESSTTGQNWTGQAIISGRHPKTDAAGLVTISYDFTGYGALTAATA